MEKLGIAIFNKKEVTQENGQTINKFTGPILNEHGHVEQLRTFAADGIINKQKRLSHDTVLHFMTQIIITTLQVKRHIKANIKA
jgi:hypothetical protein